MVVSGDRRHCCFARRGDGSQRDGPAPVRATLFVAVNGNDAWCMLAAPDAPRSDGPLATLAKARDKLRELPRRSLARRGW